MFLQVVALSEIEAEDVALYQRVESWGQGND
jgi:hypothetical protein